MDSLTPFLVLFVLCSACSEPASDAHGGSDAGTVRSPDAGDPFSEPSPIVDHDIAWGLTCPERTFPADFGVRFGSDCAPSFGGGLDCRDVIECTSDADCAAEPFARCTGAGRAHCSYPIELAECSLDADCTALPGGACPVYSRNIFCLPSGECDHRPRVCVYPAFIACETDAECDAVPGGRCDKTIEQSTCHPHACASDADCTDRGRCTCRQGEGRACVYPTCDADEDCEPGQRCVRPNEVGALIPEGSFCTTPDDECRSDEDCSRGEVCFREATSPRFTCESVPHDAGQPVLPARHR